METLLARQGGERCRVRVLQGQGLERSAEKAVLVKA